MTLFTNWLIGEMGNPGEFQYQPIHLYSTAVVLAAVVIAAVLGSSKRLSDVQKRGILKGICLFQLGFEVLWRLIYVFVKKDSILCWWPMYPCNLGGILLPLIGLMDWKKGKRMFYLFGFVGGCLTFALPEGIFCRDVLVFPILKSILQHTGLLLIPVFEYAWGSYRASVKDMGYTIGGTVIHLINCEGIDRLLGFTGDYMFFRSGMPFVIPGVSQYITLSVFGLLVLTLLAFLSDMKASISFLRSPKKDKISR